MAEVLVIGGGMAGAIAALSAARSGARVIVARRALGATALSSGAIDVAVDPHPLKAEVLPIEEAARRMARANRHHPYAILSDRLPRLLESLHFAAAQLPSLLSPPMRNNVLLPTPLGTVKPTAMAQISQISADLSSLPEEVAMVQFAISPQFDARLIVAGLEVAAASNGRTLRVRLVDSHWFHQRHDAQKGPAQLAAILDRQGAVEDLANELGRVLPAGIGMVLLPPLIGCQALDLCARLSALLHLPCAEILSAAPSVPGLRLQTALDQAIRAAGIELFEEEVKAHGPSPRTLMIGAKRELHPTSVVLATGRFIAGGIARTGAFRETVFGLPVYVDSERLEGQHLGDWLSTRFAGEHRAFRAGIRIDAELRPLSSEGAVFYRRLYAAGSVIGGYDPAADKSGLGVATFTGYLAGEAAAQSG